MSYKKSKYQILNGKDKMMELSICNPLDGIALILLFWAGMILASMIWIFLIHKYIRKLKKKIRTLDKLVRRLSKRGKEQIKWEAQHI